MKKVTGFTYSNAPFRYHRRFKNGQWQPSELSNNNQITLSEASTALHYGQQCFEGLKAYRTKKGEIQLFRPDQNAHRLINSCERLLMPTLPIDAFIAACIEVVQANQELVPEYGTGASLYLRALMLGTGDMLGVSSAPEFLFCIFVCPVGAYFADGITPVTFCTTPYDRAAPLGTGSAKVGGNYAASMLPNKLATARGFKDCIYLDPQTHTKIEEVGAANFFGITHHDEFITPKSDSILPSITKYSLLYLAEHVLGMKTFEQDCLINDLQQFKEAGACGTAAVITPIKAIEHLGTLHEFPTKDKVGTTTLKLYELLTGIQFGDIAAPVNDWIVKV